MLFNKFILIIIIIINKTIQYYKLQYGRLVLNYYDNENCLNNINETIEYPINDDEFENELMVLKEDNSIEAYTFSFYYRFLIQILQVMMMKMMSIHIKGV